MNRPGRYHKYFAGMISPMNLTCGLRVLGAVRRCELECFGHSFETWFAILLLVGRPS
jgi:hypothetical protein